MLKEEKKGDRENEDIRLLEEWLPMINRKNRAYLKGAAEALVYAQEEEKKFPK